MGHPQGDYHLRVSIAAYLHEAGGVRTEPENIIVSAGTEYLMGIILSLLPLDNLVGLENPCYFRLKPLFETYRRQYCTLSLDESGVEMSAILQYQPDLISITPSHQFPTGIIYPVSRRHELLHWANQSSHRYIIEDDYDSEFKYAGRPIMALKAMDMEDKVIYLGSFSKSISPALRISYMVLPDALLSVYKSNRSIMLCPVATLEQRVLQRFMDDGHFSRHLNRMRKVYKHKREIIVRSFRAEGLDMEVLGADAGLHLVIRFGDNPPVTREVIRRAREANLNITSLRDYWLTEMPEDLGTSYLLSYASITESEIEESIHSFCRGLSKSGGTV